MGVAGGSSCRQLHLSWLDSSPLLAFPSPSRSPCSQKVPAIAAAFHELRTRHPTTLGSSKGKGVPAAMRAALTDPACGLHWAVARLPQPGQPGDEPAGCPGVGAFHPGRLRQPC